MIVFIFLFALIIALEPSTAVVQPVNATNDIRTSNYLNLFSILDMIQNVTDIALNNSHGSLQSGISAMLSSSIYSKLRQTMMISQQSKIRLMSNITLVKSEEYDLFSNRVSIPLKSMQLEFKKVLISIKGGNISDGVKADFDKVCSSSGPSSIVDELKKIVDICGASITGNEGNNSEKGSAKNKCLFASQINENNIHRLTALNSVFLDFVFALNDAILFAKICLLEPKSLLPPDSTIANRPVSDVGKAICTKIFEWLAAEKLDLSPGLI